MSTEDKFSVSVWIGVALGAVATGLAVAFVAGFFVGHFTGHTTTTTVASAPAVSTGAETVEAEPETAPKKEAKAPKHKEAAKKEGAAAPKKQAKTPEHKEEAKKEAKSEAGGGNEALLATGKGIVSSTCSACHTLSEAGASGSVGPNLDELKPSKALVEKQVTNGGSVMPAFGGTLSKSEIEAVAEYVSKAAGTGNDKLGG